MFLTELFTRPVQYEFTKDKPDSVRASFVIEELIYRVYMNLDTNPDAFELGGPTETFSGMWDINFSVSSLDSHGGYGEEDGITDTGNAIAVFSTVIDIVQETVAHHNIQSLYFTAEESSRAKLYDRMAKHFAKKGWRYIDNREISARSSGIQGSDRFVNSFILTKQPHPHSLLKGTKHDSKT